jgi:hypothetical protein
MRGQKLLITPQKQKGQELLQAARSWLKAHRTVSAEVVTRHLNPLLRGWAMYYRHVVSKQTFQLQATVDGLRSCVAPAIDGASAPRPECCKHVSLAKVPGRLRLYSTARAHCGARRVKAFPGACVFSQRAQYFCAAGWLLRAKTAAAAQAHVIGAWPSVAGAHGTPQEGEALLALGRHRGGWGARQLTVGATRRVARLSWP